MKLIWHGHSCFELVSSLGSAVFDPYEPGSVPGLGELKLEADMVLCSHGHRDHGYLEGVKLSGRSCGLKVETVESFHDEVKGRKRGGNLIHIVDAGDMRFVHLGDLGHPLSREQLERLGRVDVLMIPVGGFYTIDGREAISTVKKINPRITVPMHYRGAGFGYSEISTAEDFLKGAENVKYYGGNVLEPEKVRGRETAVLSLSGILTW
ncbi:MAG: MBL fold metallo-hydrolase [Candidatus Limivicinus sp.]|jgi:L-ascorbate metabolism protein UlaG (beta-lactamase superfamily)